MAEPVFLDFDLEEIPRKRLFVPPPTVKAFQADDSFVRVIMGPIGSGKSVGCVAEIWKRAAQMRADRHGIRRSRWAVVRQTYPELRSTTIKTWNEWSGGDVVYGAPITTHVRALLPDNTMADLEVLFLAMEYARDVRKVLSLDLSGAWVNELIQIEEDVLMGIQGRLGRYPPLLHFEDDPQVRAVVGMTDPNWKKKFAEIPLDEKLPILRRLSLNFGMIADTNMPDDDHYVHHAEIKRPQGWNFWIQPGGMLKKIQPNGEVFYIPNPAAENIENHILGHAYYEQIIPGKRADWIKRYVLAEYGSVFTGRPVYLDEWVERVHVSEQPLQVYGGLPVLWGSDFGLTPALVCGQLTPQGQLRIFREFVCPYGALEPFVEAVVLPVIAREWPGMPMRSWGDPSGATPGQRDGTTCIGALTRLGFNCMPAPGNNSYTPRRDAVIKLLKRMGGFIVDNSPLPNGERRCPVLTKGFNGGYQFARVRSADGGEIYHYEPLKNIYSHVHDALQYLVLGATSPFAGMESGMVLPVAQRDTWRGAV